MISLLGRMTRPAGAALIAAIGFTFVMPVQAQDAQAEARLRRIESEVRAIQRKVFPGPDGKVFTPEITAPASATSASATPAPTATAMTGVLVRLDALEAQLARLTAQSELHGNRLAQIEAKLGIAAPDAAAGTASPAPSTTPATESNLSTMTGGASATRPPATSTAGATGTPSSATGTAPAASVTPKPAASTTPKPAAAATGPTAQRLAGVRAIEKPATADPGDDEYSYGFRLWEAKFYPEAQQQLKLFVDKYSRHPRISFGRNLLGRAYLDDGKPRDAATWFLQNYQTDKAGARASDSLLYLGVSMKQLNDTSRACIALAEFAETYSAEAAGRLKSLYDQTRSGLKCQR